jgi:hypothetical protein
MKLHMVGTLPLPVHDICHIHGPLVCNLLPAVHALTGCDTTSSFFRIGKKTVLKTLQDNIDEFADLNKGEHLYLET